MNRPRRRGTSGARRRQRCTGRRLSAARRFSAARSAVNSFCVANTWAAERAYTQIRRDSRPAPPIAETDHVHTPWDAGATPERLRGYMQVRNPWIPGAAQKLSVYPLNVCLQHLFGEAQSLGLAHRANSSAPTQFPLSNCGIE